MFLPEASMAAVRRFHTTAGKSTGAAVSVSQITTNGTWNHYWKGLIICFRTSPRNELERKSTGVFCDTGEQECPVNRIVQKPLARIFRTGMGGTGYQPVPPGHWPGGMEVMSPASGKASVCSVSPPFRSAGCRPAQAGSLCYPFDV